MVFEVSAFLHALPGDVEKETFGWLLEQLDLIARYQWRQTMTNISVTEAAFGRALARALGQDVPDLPGYDKKPVDARQRVREIPEWQALFEAANARK